MSAFDIWHLSMRHRTIRPFHVKSGGLKSNPTQKTNHKLHFLLDRQRPLVERLPLLVGLLSWWCRLQFVAGQLGKQMGVVVVVVVAVVVPAQIPILVRIGVAVAVAVAVAVGGRTLAIRTCSSRQRCTTSSS